MLDEVVKDGLSNDGVTVGVPSLGTIPVEDVECEMVGGSDGDLELS